MGQSNRQLKDSILRTLHYHDLFDYPLEQGEIHRFLIDNSELKTPTYAKASAGRQNSKPNLKTQNLPKNLIKERKIISIDNYYCLHGREKIINLRKEREKYSLEKIKIAKRVIQLIKLIPWIKMVGITGALAMNNSREDDDIDLLITTTKDRLWLTRFLLIIILEILSKRRRPQDKNYKNKICLNMFLDETALVFTKEKQNLFIAHEIVQLKPIINKDFTYEKFLMANNWLRKYLPNSFKTQNFKFTTQKSYILHLTSYIFNFFDKLAYQLQLKYMQSKRTREEISSHFAFFHPKDRTKEILKKYYSIFSKSPSSFK